MPKILVVEDNEDTRELLMQRLERHGFSVVWADDGVAGVKAAQSERPDLILMDINMPQLDGWEATRQIHATVGIEQTPVIALSAHAHSGDRRLALEAGCIDYHTKPIDFTKLLEQIEQALRAEPRPQVSPT
ncbi:MAG: response regulator [Pirellulaceae bacterium]|nr:response regulator [Pirellulaceae bacterium]